MNVQVSYSAKNKCYCNFYGRWTFGWYRTIYQNPCGLLYLKSHCNPVYWLIWENCQAGITPLLQHQFEELSKQKTGGASDLNPNKRRKMVVIGQDCVEPLQALRSASNEVVVQKFPTAIVIKWTVMNELQISIFWCQFLIQSGVGILFYVQFLRGRLKLWYLRRAWIWKRSSRIRPTWEGRGKRWKNVLPRLNILHHNPPYK